MDRTRSPLHTTASRRRDLAGEFLRLAVGQGHVFAWEAIADGTPAGDPWTICVFEPEAVVERLPIDWDRIEPFDRAFRRALRPGVRERWEAALAVAFDNGDPSLRHEIAVGLCDGTTRWLMVDTSIERTGFRQWRLVSICTDVSALKRSEHRLQELMATARCLLWEADVVDGVWHLNIVDEAQVRTWLPMEQEPGESLATAFYRLRHPDDRRDCDARAQAALSGAIEHYRQEFRLMDAHGCERWLLEDVVVEARGEGRWHLMGICRDGTEYRANAERLAFQASHDALTGLANRAALLNRLDAALRKPDGPPALIFFDLDNFKVINDSLGHLAGDALLVALGERIRAALDPELLVARLGGDEFTVLLPGPTDEDMAVEVGDAVAEALSRPFPVEGRLVTVSASIGIARGGATAADFLRNADTAMYSAKAQGKARIALFQPEMNRAARERFEMEAALREGLADDEFFVVYQPIVALRSGHLRAMEALLRWQREDGSYIAPERFIPVAEETGLIKPLGDLVLREACRQTARWRRTAPDLRVGVNLSARQFNDPQFVALVEEVLKTTGLPGNALVLEITESLLMQNTAVTLQRFEALRSLGCGLVVDDFGTGYSSMAYLSRMPIDGLKIDRAFVRRLRDPDRKVAADNEAIVRMVIALARTLTIGTTAEGIEDITILPRLAALGADCGQGYAIARPLTATAATHFLAGATELDEAA